MRLKIVSWNIQQGGGSRVNAILKYLLTKKTDIIVLNEFKNNTQGITIRSKLLQNGYLHQIVSAATSDLNSVLIASKIPCGSQLINKEECNFPQAILIGEMEVFDVYGVYLPHKKKHNCFEAILEKLKERERPAVICGDYNTGKNYIDQKGNSFMYSQFLTKFEKLNFQDAFRLIHNDKEEYSWFSHQGNGYRYDHTYVSEELVPLVRDCYYDQTAREEKFSDHAPMFLELG